MDQTKRDKDRPVPTRRATWAAPVIVAVLLAGCGGGGSRRATQARISLPPVNQSTDVLRHRKLSPAEYQKQFHGILKFVNAHCPCVVKDGRIVSERHP